MIVYLYFRFGTHNSTRMFTIRGRVGRTHENLSIERDSNYTTGRGTVWHLGEKAVVHGFLAQDRSSSKMSVAIMQWCVIDYWTRASYVFRRKMAKVGGSQVLPSSARRARMSMWLRR